MSRISRFAAIAFASFLALLLAGRDVQSAMPQPIPMEALSGQGCTSFCLNDHDSCVFGANYDNEFFAAQLFVNKRNVSKTGWESSTTGERAAWTSKYGSLTFNVIGYQLPWAGMNEAGLMISTLGVNSQYPNPDKRPPLVYPLWVQYQLDHYSTVDEVIASDAWVRITTPAQELSCHFLACDRKGDCAVIEFLDGKMVAYTGQTLPVKALTNSTYEESVQAWHERSLEELAEVEESGFSLFRFGKAADRVTSFAPTDSKAAVGYAFDTLAQASSSWTNWSIVFDAPNLQVFFRSKWNSQIRRIDFSQLDFSCDTPVKTLDVHTNLAGDISNELIMYSHQASLDHLVSAFKGFRVDMPQSQIEALLQQVENYPCTEGDGQPAPGTRRGSWWYALVAAAGLILVFSMIGYTIRRRKTLR